MCEFDFVREVIPPEKDESVAGWLEAQMNESRRFLLVHTDDGVIWGHWHDDRLLTSHEVARDTASDGVSPPLVGIMVQQAFVFGEQSEVRLFRDELGAWTAREISGSTGEDTIVESQLLTGDEVIRAWSQEGFTHLRDKKQQGLDQIVPLPISDTDMENGKRPRLTIYHFIAYDEDSGEARIGLSRLVNVDPGPVEESA